MSLLSPKRLLPTALNSRAKAPLSQRWESVQQHFDETSENLNKTNTVQALKEVAEDEKRQFTGLGVLVDRGIGTTIKTTKSLTSLIPGKQALRSLQEQRPEDMRDAEALQAKRDTIGEREFIRSPE